MATKNETVKQILDEIIYCRKVQEAFFLETLEILRDIKQSIVMIPFVDRKRIFDKYTNQTTNAMLNKLREDEEDED